MNLTYLVKNRIYSNSSISNFKKYFYPLDLNSVEIKDDEKSFLYLKVNKSYILNFTNNKINKMSRSPSKTKNSKLKVSIEPNKEVKELNQYEPYYQLNNGYNGIIILEVKEEDAFIEFLSNSDDLDIKENAKINNYQLNKDNLIIVIPKTQKYFTLKIKSDDALEFALSLGITNNKSYYYSSNTNEKINLLKKELELKYLPYKYIEVLENEFISLAIKEKITKKLIFLIINQVI